MAPSSPIEVAVHPDRALRAPDPVAAAAAAVAAASASAAAAGRVADAAACAAPECSAPAPPAPAPAAPAAPDVGPPDFSTEQQRELDGVLELLKCPVRQRILFALAAANDAGATDGSGGNTGERRLNVTALARRTAIEQKTLSHHLALLRTAGLVFQTRRGKSTIYEVADGRVVFRRDAATGGYSLTVFARGSGVSVTIALGRAQGLSESAPAVSTSAERFREKQPSRGDCVALSESAAERSDQPS